MISCFGEIGIAYLLLYYCDMRLDVSQRNLSSIEFYCIIVVNKARALLLVNDSSNDSPFIFSNRVCSSFSLFSVLYTDEKSLLLSALSMDFALFRQSNFYLRSSIHCVRKTM